jgi:hypothetical protein
MQGLTYLKIAYNPIWTDSALSKTTPTFGVRIECPGGGCNGMPCNIDPSKNGVGVVDSPVAAVGVGGASFCVITVPKGKTANIVVFNTDGTTGTVSTSSAGQSATTSSSSSSKTSSSLSQSSTISSSSSSMPSYMPGIFHENSTATVSVSPSGSHSTSTSGSAKPTNAETNEAVSEQGGAAIAGLIVALVAAAALY